jgi:amino acid adenylation domain-containing protein
VSNPATTPAKRGNVEDIYPLTPIQRGLLFHTLFAPESGVYIEQLGFTIEGALDAESFRRAWQAVLDRHPVLRTAFVTEDLKEPLQVVRPRVDVPWMSEDWRDVPPAEQDVRLGTLSTDHRTRPFTLDRPPLMRMALVRLAETKFKFFWTFHHVLLDGWSVAMVLREVELFYGGLRQGREAALPRPRPFRDLIAWFKKQDPSAAESYWRNVLEGFETPTPLGIDVRPGTNARKQEFGTERLEICAPKTAKLQAFARRHNLTLNTVVQGAWAILLSRYGGTEDVVYGATSSGRPADLPGSESMVGLFITMLPVRARVSEQSSVLSLLKGLQGQLVNQREYEYAPLVDIQGWSEVPRATPLFESAFVFENFPVQPFSDAREAGLSVREDAPSSRSNYPLMVVVAPGEKLSMRVDYDASRFRAETVERMLAHFGRLLEETVANPDGRVSELSMLSEPERVQLEAWNDTAAVYSHEGPVHQLFEMQAARTPDAVAVAGPAGQLTYRALNARANQLARYLTGRGVGPEIRVALCLSRSVDLLVGVLGIMKAGGVYVPIDPEHPPDRLAFILTDCAAAVVVTERALRERLPAHGGQTVCLDVEEAEIARQPGTNPTSRVGADSLSHVIYTSGSTGQPKGVAVQHGSVSTLVQWSRVHYSDDDLSGVLAATSVCFDLSVWEFFVPLSWGGTVVLVGNVMALPTLAAADRVTLINTVPSAIAELLRQGAIPASVRTVNLAGEPLTTALADAVYAVPTIRRVCDLYGPSEDTTYSTFAERARGGVATIGRPLSNTQAYVRGPGNDALVPSGVAGELSLGGAGLARGYLARPDLTAERFVPDPYAAPGRRLYRTGDRVRRLPDGQLEFLGRIDHQVKIRGFRIELGEIETVLARHARLKDAVVVVRDDSQGDKRLVAYLVPDGAPPDAAELRQYVKAALPEYMVPGLFVMLEALPRTPSGKVDRRALPDPTFGTKSAAHTSPRSDVERQIAEIWQEALGLPTVGIHDNFFDLGGHSLLLVRVHTELAKRLSLKVPLVTLFEFPTVAALAAHVAGEPAATPQPQPRERAQLDDLRVAIIGLAGKFPGASNVEAFWSQLRDGVEGIRTFGEDELRAAGVSETTLSDPQYVRRRGVLSDDEVAGFDAELFGYPPREAEQMDPQHRVFLECAWAALERAGYGARPADVRVGVWAGASTSVYGWATRGMEGMIARGTDYLPTRVSYKLNLRGPSVNVQTACSTSLVAVHAACQSLRQRECEMALAGGVSIAPPVVRGYRYEEGGILSPDGHCRAFDAAAEGTLEGMGVGVVVLKRYADAVRDGDPIQAVILGTAINNDGSQKVGFTAPSVEGQAAAIADALAMGAIDPATVSYVEAHGTGTALGDPIEVAALAKVFGRSPRSSPCTLGAVKSNVGHLDAAAGVTGLIKTVLALRHRELPPTLHYSAPNPGIDFDVAGFRVSAELEEWTVPEGMPRRAGVSSFGLGGTNAHAVLEEAPEREAASPSRSWQLLPISARSAAALDRATDNLAAYLRAERPSLADAAYTLKVGRSLHEERRVVVCRDLDQAASALAAGDPSRVWTGVAAKRRPSVAFMFAGGGAQHPDMGRALYEQESAYRTAVDECVALLQPGLGWDLKALLFPAPERSEEAASEMERPSRSLPCLFITQYAMAKLLMSWGIEPEAMIGHSMGEYTAAHLAGVFSLEDALALVTVRGKLFETVAPGGMLSVPMAAEALAERLPKELSIAAVNAPNLCVTSGPRGALEELERMLLAEDVECSPIRINIAAHSAMLEPILAEFGAFTATIAYAAPTRRFLSNVTGTWITAQEATDPQYWVRHLRQTVRFAAGVSELLADEDRVLLEVGPSDTLRNLARRQAGDERVVLATLPHPREAVTADFSVERALGQLWIAGVEPDWSRYYANERRLRIQLPTYPFEHQRYWLDLPRPGSLLEGRSADRRVALADWFYAPAWNEVPLPGGPARRTNSDGPAEWVVFLDDAGLGDRVVAKLRETDAVTTVETGAAFSRLGARRYVINPTSRGDYVSLVGALSSEGITPTDVAHMFCARPESRESLATAVHQDQELGFYSVLWLTQSLEAAGVRSPLRLTVVTSGVQDVTGEEPLSPGRATVAGLCRVIPHEYRHIACSTIDVPAVPAGVAIERLAEQVHQEVSSPSPGTVVALRGGHRWVQAYRQLRLREVDAAAPIARLRDRGVYLITGGLGEIGLSVAEWLVSQVAARVVLVSRNGLPDDTTWDAYLREHDERDRDTRRMRRVRRIRAAGGEVVVVRANVGSPDQMRKAFELAETTWGAVHGVVHAAGHIDSGAFPSIADTDDRICARHFETKVEGLRVLDELLQSRRPDFCLLTSSISTVIGGWGFAAYAAANAFMDAFARWRSREATGIAWIGTRWDGWPSADTDEVLGRRKPTDLVMTRAEGIEVFGRILSMSNPVPVVISTADLDARIEQWFGSRKETGPAAEARQKTSHPRPDLETPYAPPRTEIERQLAAVWTELIGTAQVGIHDSFYELGGDSLLATQIVTRLRDRHGFAITLRAFLESGTVAELARRLEATRRESDAEADAHEEREEIEIE